MECAVYTAHCFFSGVWGMKELTEAFSAFKVLDEQQGGDEFLLEQKFILQIQASYNQFTKAEKKVADYVIEHQDKVIFMSITDLADACHVGDTSVYRFCRTMNLQGYQEFKMKLSLGHGAMQETAAAKEDGEEELAEKVMNLNVAAIRETYTLLNRKELKKIMDMFEASKRVYFYGVGDSLLIAQAACNKFLRITGKVVCITDPHMQAMSASIANQDDLFLFISYSGATKDTIYVAKEAKQAGAKVAVISHYHKSPLTVYSDALLLCGADEGPLDGGSMVGKMGQLYLIDLLYQEYYMRNEKACKTNNKKTSAAVLNRLY